MSIKTSPSNAKGMSAVLNGKCHVNLMKFSPCALYSTCFQQNSFESNLKCANGPASLRYTYVICDAFIMLYRTYYSSTGKTICWCHR